MMPLTVLFLNYLGLFSVLFIFLNLMYLLVLLASYSTFCVKSFYFSVSAISHFFSPGCAVWVTRTAYFFLLWVKWPHPKLLRSSVVQHMQHRVKNLGWNPHPVEVSGSFAIDVSGAPSPSLLMPGFVALASLLKALYLHFPIHKMRIIIFTQRFKEFFNLQIKSCYEPSKFYFCTKSLVLSFVFFPEPLLISFTVQIYLSSSLHCFPIILGNRLVACVTSRGVLMPFC